MSSSFSDLQYPNDIYVLITLINTLQTSIWNLRCCLKLARSVRKIAKDNSNTWGTEETPFLDRATHRYCLIALINMSFVLNIKPAFCRIDNNSCRDSTLERNS
jgi:hypothetical protein